MKTVPSWLIFAGVAFLIAYLLTELTYPFISRWIKRNCK